MKIVSRAEKAWPGRHLTVLCDDGSVVVKLKLYLRGCVEHLSLSEAARRINYSKATVSKALSGTSVPMLGVTCQIARLKSPSALRDAVELWKVAKLEEIGVRPADLVYPNPKNTGELAALLRAYVLTAHLNADNLIVQPDLRLGDVAMLSRHRKVGRSLSRSTVNRMLSGKTLIGETLGCENGMPGGWVHRDRWTQPRGGYRPPRNRCSRA